MKTNIESLVGFVIAKTQGKIRAELIQRLKEYNITPTQWAILSQLSDTNGIPPTEISKITFKDIPNTIRMLQKLEKNNLVYHHQDPSDRRVSFYYLTEDGIRVSNILTNIVIEVMDNATEGIDADMIDKLIELLNRIYDNLSK